MRHYMRKPRSLKMCEYIATVVKQCDDLKYFPDYTATDKFDDDELCNIVKFGSPPVWHNMMLIQGFDITDHTLDELVEFCEHLESVEEIYDAHMKPEAKPKADVKHGSNYENICSARSPSGDSSHFQNWKCKDMEGKYCPLHNTNSHNMADCKVIREQVSKMHASWNLRSSNVAKHQKRTYQPDSKGKLTDKTMYEFMAKMFNSNRLKKRKILNVKERQTPKEKIPSAR